MAHAAGLCFVLLDLVRLYSVNMRAIVLYVRFAAGICRQTQRSRDHIPVFQL